MRKLDSIEAIFIAGATIALAVAGVYAALLLYCIAEALRDVARFLFCGRVM